jgi:RNA polymerase sigma-70 factor, ECF subfamily
MATAVAGMDRTVAKVASASRACTGGRSWCRTLLRRAIGGCRICDHLLPAMTTAPPSESAPFDALFARVYEELRRIASRQLAKRGGGTVTTTALVHEAYLRLAQGREAEWHDRAHFFALAARAMRFVLVDHARARVAVKRGGAQPVTLDDAMVAHAERPEELLAIHEALERLHVVGPRLAQVVQLRFFAGLSHEEIAELTGMSVPTVKRDWARARAWLHHFMTDASSTGQHDPE